MPQSPFGCTPPQSQQRRQHKTHAAAASDDIKPMAANLVPKLEAIDTKSTAASTADMFDSAATITSATPPPTPLSKDGGGKNDVGAASVQESFFNETLELSQEDIQKTLSANMPLATSVPIAVGAGVEPIISDDSEINPMDFINNCCDDGRILL